METSAETECSLEEFECLEAWVPAVAVREDGKVTLHPVIGNVVMTQLEIPREQVATVRADTNRVGPRQRVALRLTKPLSLDLATLAKAFEPHMADRGSCVEGCTGCDFTGFQTCTFWDGATNTCVTTRNQCAQPNGGGFFGPTQPWINPEPWWAARGRVR